MSWISFYLGKDNIPSRTMIGVKFKIIFKNN